MCSRSSGWRWSSRLMADQTIDTTARARRSVLPWPELAALALYGLALVLARPLDPFEWDEVLFQRALDRYDVANHSPHPPGYPLYVAIAKVVRLAVGDPQLALQIVGIGSALAALVLTWLLARRLGAPRSAATLAAATLAVIPGFAFNANIGMSDVPGVAAAVGVALLFVLAWDRPGLLVVAAAAAGILSGIRIASLIPAMPFAVVAFFIAWRRSAWRWLVFSQVAFVFAAVAVWLPAVLVTGPERFSGAVQQQAEYIQRAWVHMRLPGAQGIDIIRAWGVRWLGVLRMAAMLWVLVLVGAVAWWLRCRRRLATVMSLGAGAFLLFVVYELEYDLAMRYAIPAAPFLAILASGVAVLRRPAMRLVGQAALALWIAGTAVWLAPAFAVRLQPAPVWQALHYVRASFLPERTRVMSDAAMGPHVDYVLRRAGFTFESVSWEHLSDAVAGAGPDVLFVTPTAPAGAEVLFDLDWRSPLVMRLARDRYGSCAVWRKSRRPARPELSSEIVAGTPSWRLEGTGTVALPASARPVVMYLESRTRPVVVRRPGLPPATLAPGTPLYTLVFPGRTGALRLSAPTGEVAELEPVDLFDLRAENPVAGVAPAFVVPQVAHVDGSFASQWRTTLYLFNPNVFPLRVSLQLLATGQANTEVTTAAISLAPGEFVEVPDVVALPDLAARAGAGALILSAVSAGLGPPGPAPFVATSRTFNLRSTSPEGDAGECLPAVPLGDGLCRGATATFRDVTTDRRRRANLGVTALAGAAVRVRVVLRNPAGAAQESAEWELPPFGHLQSRLSDGLAGGSVDIEIAGGPDDARVFAYLSQIDRDTGAPAHALPEITPGCAAAATPPLPRGLRPDSPASRLP